MTLHQLTSVTIGVPNVEEVAQFYTAFGLARDGNGFSTTDGGTQLFLREASHRCIDQIVMGADHAADLGAIASRLKAMGVEAQQTPDRISVADRATGIEFQVRITPRERPASSDLAGGASMSAALRVNARSPAIARTDPVHPRKLGHIVIGCPEPQAAVELLVNGLGLKVSDVVEGHASFLRCSSDHHNILLQHGPVTYLHHTSWQVDDVDEVGRGAAHILKRYPNSHVWGLGRHVIGSNFFWYLRDPAGNFVEYYADMDEIADDKSWTPKSWDASPESAYLWGPSVPIDMIAPGDLQDLLSAAGTRA